MRPTTAQNAPTAECPRCAYELAGTVARWTTSCDLQGMCPECGLVFDWCDVMNPARTMPRWFYEAPARSPWINFARTLVRLFRPRRFWGRISLACPIHVRRLVLLVLSMLLATHMLFGAAAGLLRYAEFAVATTWTGRSGGTLTTPSVVTFYGPVVLWPYAAHQFVLPYTYLTPASVPGGAPVPATSAMVFTSAQAGGPALAVPAIAVTLMPLTYLLLGDTMRRTRVRPLHLLRVFAYSTVLLPILGTAHIVCWPAWRDILSQAGGASWTVSRLLHEIQQIEDFAPLNFLLLLTLVATLLVWWHASTTRYLRLPHAIGVVVAMLIITFLAIAIFISYADAWSAYGKH